MSLVINDFSTEILLSEILSTELLESKQLVSSTINSSNLDFSSMVADSISTNSISVDSINFDLSNINVMTVQSTPIDSITSSDQPTTVGTIIIQSMPDSIVVSFVSNIQCASLTAQTATVNQITVGDIVTTSIEFPNSIIDKVDTDITHMLLVKSQTTIFGFPLNLVPAHSTGLTLAEKILIGIAVAVVVVAVCIVAPEVIGGVAEEAEAASVSVSEASSVAESGVELDSAGSGSLADGGFEASWPIEDVNTYAGLDSVIQ